MTDFSRPPSPTVVGPLLGGVRGWPFGAPVEDLEARGYVIEEFIVEGFASRYRLQRDARWSDREGLKTRRQGTEFYRTRFYILAPRDPTAFNGVLIANWQNVSRKIDVGAPDGDEIYRGYAWAGITTQKLGVDGQPGETPGLAQWDHQRYRGLTHPGDAYSYDIFAQTARLLRDGPCNGAPDPLRGMRPSMVVAAGRSQSAMRLGSYLNFAHQHDGLFDAYLLAVHFGICPPLDEPDFLSLFTPDAAGRFPAQSKLRDAGDAKILAFSTECEALYNFGARQPDTDSYRFWEIAGASHSNPQRDLALRRIFERDGVTGAQTDSTPANSLEYQYVKDSALRWLVRWRQRGDPPPSFAPIAIDHDRTGRPQFCRDQIGNTLGGIRLPELAASTGVYLGSSGGDVLQSLSGSSQRFGKAQLMAIHGSEETLQRAWQCAVMRLEQVDLLTTDEAKQIRSLVPWDTL